MVVAVGGAATIQHSTLSGNQAELGGGMNSQSSLTMRHTIVAGNMALKGPDLQGLLIFSGYNLFGNSQGGSGYDPTDLLDVNPLLGPLQDNGGPTWTHALLLNSPAINRGEISPAAVGSWPEWDQRGPGFARVVGGALDIGAFEVQGGGSGPAGGGDTGKPNSHGSASDSLPAGDLVSTLRPRRSRTAFSDGAPLWRSSSNGHWS